MCQTCWQCKRVCSLGCKECPHCFVQLVAGKPAKVETYPYKFVGDLTDDLIEDV